MSRYSAWFAVSGFTLIGVWSGLFGQSKLDDEASRLIDAARATLSFEIFLGLLALAGAVFASGGPARRLGLASGRLSPRQTSTLIVGTLGMSAALDALLDLSQLREHSTLAEFELLVAGIRGRELATAFLAFAIAPGICEELLCRGLLQRGLVTRLGAPLGILLASVIFGALHLDPVHSAFAGLLGLYLGAICYSANGIRAGIACHVANNSVALASAAFFPEPWVEMNWGIFFIGAAVALGAIWRVRVQLESASPETARAREPAADSARDRGDPPAFD